MTVRAGMVNLIAELRNLTNASTEADFTDEFLQTKLDFYKQQYRYVIIVPDVTRVNQDTVIYTDYFLPDEIGEWFEIPVDYTINEYFYLTDYNFVPILFGTGADYATYDDDLKMIRLGKDSLGKFVTLTLYSYDIYASAAELWGFKAARRSELVDFKSDNHSANLSETKATCLQMQAYYASRSYRNQDAKFIRKDQGAGYDRDGQHAFVTRLRRGIPLN